MEPKILGANIRKYRKQMGITQEKLAERIRKSVNYIGMIERGEKVPSLKTFILLANALGTSTDVLLAGITENSYAVQDSLLHELICKLDNTKRTMLYSVIDAFLNSAGKGFLKPYFFASTNQVLSSRNIFVMLFPIRQVYLIPAPPALSDAARQTFNMLSIV